MRSYRVKNENKNECCENMLHVNTRTAEGERMVGFNPNPFFTWVNLLRLQNKYDSVKMHDK